MANEWVDDGFECFVSDNSRQRRRERRLRSAARLHWFLHCRGYQPLDKSQLLRLRSHLAAHHSRDQTLLKKIDIHVKMASSPWRCTPCDRGNAASSLYCGKCGKRWEEVCWDWNANQTTWDWENWKEEPKKKKRPKKPKDKGTGNANDRSLSAHPRGKGKGKGKKGKSNSGDASAKPSLSPFGGSGAPFPPWPTQEGSPFTVATTPALDASSPRHQELLDALKQAYSGDNEPPDHVKDLIERTEKDVSKEMLREMHGATTALGRAQRVLKEAQDARKAHRATWMRHLIESTKAWETQLDTFRTKQAQLQEAAVKARQDLNAARQRVQGLNPKAVGGQPTELPPLEEAEPIRNPALDSEVAQLKEKLQNTLNACAAAAGVEAGCVAVDDDGEISCEDFDEDKKRKLAASKSSSFASNAYEPIEPVCAARCDDRLLGLPPCCLTYSHSVVYSEDFLDEFAAISQALALQAEVLDYEYDLEYNEQIDYVSDEYQPENESPANRFAVRRPPQPNVHNWAELPRWCQTLQAAIDAFGATELAEEGPVIYIQTFFIHGEWRRTSSERRPVRLDAQVATWKECIADAWDDIFDPDAGAWDYFVVFPPSFIWPVTEGIACHLIVTQNQLHDEAAILTTISDPRPRRVAGYLPNQCHLEDVVQAAGFAWPDDSMQYTGWYFRRPIREAPLAAVALPNGAGIDLRAELHVLPAVQAEADDLTLMQQSLRQQARQEADFDGGDFEPDDDGIARDDRLIPAMIYRKGSWPLRILIRMRNYEHMLQDVTRILGVNPQRALALHEIPCALADDPPDLHSFVLQMQTDLQLGNPSKLVVLDVVIYNTNSPTDTPRSNRLVVVAPPWLMRANVLEMADVQDYCTMVTTNRCLVYWNGRLWKSDDGGLRQVKHGYYMRVVVPPQEDMPHMTTCEILRDVYWDGGPGFIDIPAASSHSQPAVPSSPDYAPTTPGEPQEEPHEPPELVDLEQLDLMQRQVKVNMKPAFDAFAWIDSHMFLPCFDLVQVYHHLPVESLAWLDHWWEPGVSFEHLRVYFDGAHSKSSDKAGLGVAAWVFGHGQWAFAGALSAALPPGAIAYDAEQHAAAVAAKFAYDILKLNPGLCHHTAVEFIYDNVTVGQQLMGNWTARSNPVLGTAARSIFLLLSQRFGVQPVGCHVYGHTGEPGNSLVDTLAALARDESPLQDLSHFLQVVNQKNRLPGWSWMWTMFDPQYPVDWASQSLQVPDHAVTQPSVDVLPPELKTRTSSPAEVCELQLTCCSFNVRSLKGATVDGVTGPTRQELLMVQLEDLGVHVFGLQESRLQRLHWRHDSRFWLYHSPATRQGHGGIVLGLSRSRPYGQVVSEDPNVPDRPLYFQDDHVKIVCAVFCG
eukprot:Skav201055  [mRNA]  locus=scaffold215:260288:266747:- [translate_table: standard]